MLFHIALLFYISFQQIEGVVVVVIVYGSWAISAYHH
jgi:hypothetical protein